MKCRHLNETNVPTCSATDRPYIPSSFELQEYCRRDRFRMCPFYRVRTPHPAPGTNGAEDESDTNVQE